jgi:hypothetical protein
MLNADGLVPEFMRVIASNSDRGGSCASYPLIHKAKTPICEFESEFGDAIQTGGKVEYPYA